MLTRKGLMLIGLALGLAVVLLALASEKLDLPEGDADFTVLGPEGSNAGDQVCIGDWNGDGDYDVAIGAPRADFSGRDDAGSVFVFFGPLTQGEEIDLETESADLTVGGVQAGDRLNAIRHAGDFDGDGTDDLMVTAPYADGDETNQGAVYVLPGRSSWPATIDLSSESNDLEVYGPAGSLSRGRTVGDLDNDGLADVVLDAGGELLVVYGRPQNDWPEPSRQMFLGSTHPPDARITRTSSGDPYDFGVNCATGDHDGDGTGDLLIGSPEEKDSGEFLKTGRSYLILGPVAGEYTLAGGADLTVYGREYLGDVGFAVDLDDLNGDGFDDLVTGAPWAGWGNRPLNPEGETSILFGRPVPPAEVDLAVTAPDVRIRGRTDTWFGQLLATGDATGDGIADLFASRGSHNVTSPVGTWGFRGRTSWPTFIDLDQEEADLEMIDLSFGGGYDRGLACGKGVQSPFAALLIGHHGGSSDDGRADLVMPRDTDGDGTSDWGDLDVDDDGVPDEDDNCFKDQNPDQEDTDDDGVGNACDNCPDDANPGQEDSDGDGFPDACDVCPGIPDPGQPDGDGDRVGDLCDNCPGFPHPDQIDSDLDGTGNPCDEDDDNDGKSDETDNCPLVANTNQKESDGDGVGDVCDNCPDDPNPLQRDSDGDGHGNQCDPGPHGEILVDDDGSTPTLQGALDLAGQIGDRVRVLPGTYPGCFHVPAGVHLLGSGPQVTVLNGEDLCRTVTLEQNTVLEGFTVTGGAADDGGGVKGSYGDEETPPTVHNNVIRGNSATAHGGGVQGALNLIGNVIEQNYAGNRGGGGYIWNRDYYFYSYDPLKVRDNAIRDNEAGTEGGGLYINGYAAVILVTDNLVQGNRASHGGGIDVYGGGYYHQYFNGEVTSNTITGNTATVANGVGGLRYVTGYYDWTFRTGIGNIVTENEGGGLGGFNPKYSNVWGNSPENYVNMSDRTGTWGNISADPLFRDETAGDFRLTPGSPAIDSGKPGETTDRDGIPRPQDGDLNGVAVPDMGAHEERGEVEQLRIAPDHDTITWDARPGVTVYHLYRGDLAVLRAGGGYAQDPGEVSLAERWCGLGAPQQTDAVDPPTGEVSFYLATPSGDREGNLGFDAAKTARYNAHPCP